MAPVVVLSLVFVLSLMGSHDIIPVAEAIWLMIPSSGTKCVSEAIQNNVTVLADYYVVNETQSGHTPLIFVRVTSPYGNNLHHNENVTHGRFAFTTSEAGNFVACFWVDSNHQGTGTILSLDWRTGIAAEDWESVIRKEKIGLRPLDTLERIKLGSLGTFFDKFSTYQKKYWDSVAGNKNIGSFFDKISTYQKKYWDSVARKENIEGVELHLRRLEAEVQAIHDRLIYLKNREAEMREVSEVTNSRVAWCSIMSLGVCIVASILQLWYLKRFFQKMKLI